MAEPPETPDGNVPEPPDGKASEMQRNGPETPWMQEATNGELPEALYTLKIRTAALRPIKLSGDERRPKIFIGGREIGGAGLAQAPSLPDGRISRTEVRNFSEGNSTVLFCGQ